MVFCEAHIVRVLYGVDLSQIFHLHGEQGNEIFGLIWKKVSALRTFTHHKKFGKMNAILPTYDNDQESESVSIQGKSSFTRKITYGRTQKSSCKAQKREIKYQDK